MRKKPRTPKRQNRLFVTGLLISLFTIIFSNVYVHAAQTDLASAAPATVHYKITDGYGEYNGYGDTKIKAASNAREACIMQKVTAYESRFGVTPDEDTADMFIDACINR